jgi:hypothetical protein
VFAGLIDGPLAQLPSGKFGANSAWVLCGAIAHNLLRRHPAPHDRRNPGTAGPPATTTRPASTRQLAMGTGMASSLAQHNQ